MHSLRPIDGPSVPGRIVLVMQGGGAPGCYQAGVYQALHESGVDTGAPARARGE